MLFLPLLDRAWRIPSPPRFISHYLAWAAVSIAAIVLLVWQPSSLSFAQSALLTAALPEEWFFRGYFLARLSEGFRANIITSLLFSLVHGLSRDWITALLVFAPSVFYGWLYLRTRDLPLLVLVHALSNLVFAMFLAESLASWVRFLG